MTSGSTNGTAGVPPGPRREALRLEPGASVAALLSRMSRSAFQGRKLGEAFETWRWMIDGESLICIGLAGSMASAGLWRGVFFLNLPLAAVVLAATLRGVPESRDEGADELDLPLGTVKSRQRLALDKLRRILEPVR